MESATKVSQHERFRLDEIHAGNAGEMCQLFAQVFGKSLSVDYWQWKYRQSGGHGIGAWDGEQLVAHYGGIGVDVVLDGKLVRAVEICDVMVSPAVRNSVRKYSPFYLATSTFIDRFVGYGQEFELGFGFPNDRHLLLAERLGFYSEVGTMSELRFPKAAARFTDRFNHWQSVEADQFSHHANELDALWEQMWRSMPAAIVPSKSAAKLQYRFLQHPEHRYQVWLLRQRITGKVKAAVVLKIDPERILLMDLIGARADFTSNLRQLVNSVAQHWSQPLVFWLSTAHAERLEIAGLEIKPLHISTPANIWTKGPTAAELMNRWWLTAGDTDFL